jgi:N-acetylglucosaminyldiphosphoundecaprenol N-acetyl-beta-D-mannosaminyltransferase
VVGVRDLGKKNVLGVLVDAVDREAAVARIIEAARDRRPFAATALAVHGVMTGAEDSVHRYRLNHFDLVTPDGQPVRWALNWLHGVGLAENVHGSGLTLEICRAAAERGLPIYLYGSRREVLDRLEVSLRRRFPGLVIAGAEPSKFRRTTSEEKKATAQRIRASGAAIAFVGLGCPRQEVFAFEYRDALQMPVIAVGAAFDYIAGVLRQPHPLVRRLGFEWLHRLLLEPGRLWKRYTVANAQYVFGLAVQLVGLAHPDPYAVEAPITEVMYG